MLEVAAIASWGLLAFFVAVFLIGVGLTNVRARRR